MREDGGAQERAEPGPLPLGNLLGLVGVPLGGLARDAVGARLPGEVAVFDEFARMTALSREFGRQLDLTALAGLDADAYESMSPTQWPTAGTTMRPFSDGRFATPDGRANFVAAAACLPR